MEWISVKDNLPDVLQVVDIYNPYDGRVPDVKYLGNNTGENEWVSTYLRWRGFVTHWMPIPEKPPQEV